MTKQSESNTNWNLWYVIVLVALVVQIIFYYLFTRYWA